MTKAAIETCIATMSVIIAEAASLAKAASSCAADGNPGTALGITLEIEPLLHEAKALIEAASILNRRVAE